MTAKRTEKMRLDRMRHPEWYQYRVLAYYHACLICPAAVWPVWYGY